MKTKPTSRRCPRCGAAFSDKEYFDSHWKSRECATGPMLQLPKPAPQQVAEPVKLFSECPYCGANVKSTKLPKHMRVKCPKRIPNLMRSRHSQSSKGGAPQMNRWGSSGVDQPSKKRGAVHDQVHGRDRLDATKGYAHAYREQGRFGSHPSHDSFDDESTS